MGLANSGMKDGMSEFRSGSGSSPVALPPDHIVKLGKLAEFGH